MSPEEFAKAYPPLIAWIRNTLTANAHVAKTVASHGFSRLPLYFTEETLASTKVVIVDPLPVPLLASMGLSRFAGFVRSDPDGITYIDTIFLKPTQSKNENVYFHELIHIIQWRLLGPALTSQTATVIRAVSLPPRAAYRPPAALGTDNRLITP